LRPTEIYKKRYFKLNKTGKNNSSMVVAITTTLINIYKIDGIIFRKLFITLHFCANIIIL